MSLVETVFPCLMNCSLMSLGRQFEMMRGVLRLYVKCPKTVDFPVIENLNLLDSAFKKVIYWKLEACAIVVYVFLLKEN